MQTLIETLTLLVRGKRLMTMLIGIAVIRDLRGMKRGVPSNDVRRSLCLKWGEV